MWGLLGTGMTIFIVLYNGSSPCINVAIYKSSLINGNLMNNKVDGLFLNMSFWYFHLNLRNFCQSPINSTARHRSNHHYTPSREECFIRSQCLMDTPITSKWEIYKPLCYYIVEKNPSVVLVP